MSSYRRYRLIPSVAKRAPVVRYGNSGNSQNMFEVMAITGVFGYGLHRLIAAINSKCAPKCPPNPVLPREIPPPVWQKPAKRPELKNKYNDKGNELLPKRSTETETEVKNTKSEEPNKQVVKEMANGGTDSAINSKQMDKAVSDVSDRPMNTKK